MITKNKVRSSEFGVRSDDGKSFTPNSELITPNLGHIIFKAIFCSVIIVVFTAHSAFSEQKDWSNQGDQSAWTDADNWYMSGVPGTDDDAKIDHDQANVSVADAFAIKSLTLGGKKQSDLSVSNFVTGSVQPANNTDEALTNRKDGHLILMGSTGKITLKGAYKDSEEIIPDEPTFMLFVQ